MSDQPIMNTTELSPIPTPMKLQIRRVRYQILPIVIFTVSLALTAYLWKNYAGTPHGMGEVNAVTVRVSAPSDGKLAASDAYPKLYDRVEAGQLLVRFEASALREQQAKLEDEVSKKQEELSAVNKQVEEAAADKAKAEPLKQQAAALKTALEALRSEFHKVGKHIEAANLTSPVAGTITSIKHQPNEFVKQGQDIMTITQDGGSYIVSYVRPGSAIVPRKDMKVVVRGQDNRKSAISVVQEVGTQVEPIPEHQLTNSKRPEWGIPVRITMPDASKLALRPGELVVLNFQNDPK